MSSINRQLAGPELTFDLPALLRGLKAEESYTRSGRAGRTLAKSGRLRVTITAMAKENVIGTHQSDSPMTLHVLEGHIIFRAGSEVHELRAGQLLYFGPGDAHDIEAREESALLITLSATGDDFMQEDTAGTDSPQLSGL